MTQLKQLVSAIARRSPFHKMLWDREYASGKLDRYAAFQQFARYSVIEGCCRYLKPHAKILDAGCGTGILGERFCEASLAGYTGIDLSEVATTRGRERYPRGAFITGDIRTYDFGEEQFDFIIFNESLNSIPDYVAVMNRLNRWLAPDGHFIISITSQEAEFRAAFERSARQAIVSCTEVKDAASGRSWRIYIVPRGG